MLGPATSTGAPRTAGPTRQADREHAKLVAAPGKLLADTRLHVARRQRPRARLQALDRFAQIACEWQAH